MNSGKPGRASGQGTGERFSREVQVGIYGQMGLQDGRGAVSGPLETGCVATGIPVVADTGFLARDPAAGGSWRSWRFP